jgi:hypothetical protein
LCYRAYGGALAGACQLGFGVVHDVLL